MKKKWRKRRFILLGLSLALIIIGFWFSTTNTYKFAKGYFMYKTKQTEDVVLTESQSEQKTEQKVENEHVELYPVRPEIGEEMGELYIPKLEATLPIFHGTSEDELENGVGHFAESVLPGEDDNSVLSGHRDTIFRELGEVGEGDLLIVKTSAGEFTYKVKKVRIVDEDDRTVIVPKPRATLTVSTCYPFYFVGAAPERYVLVANLISKEITAS